MGIFDSAKGMADKARDLAAEHEEKVDAALDKVAETVDEKTGGKHSARIEKARDTADGFLDKK